MPPSSAPAGPRPSGVGSCSGGPGPGAAAEILETGSQGAPRFYSAPAPPGMERVLAASVKAPGSLLVPGSLHSPPCPRSSGLPHTFLSFLRAHFFGFVSCQGCLQSRIPSALLLRLSALSGHPPPTQLSPERGVPWTPALHGPEPLPLLGLPRVKPLHATRLQTWI